MQTQSVPARVVLIITFFQFSRASSTRHLAKSAAGLYAERILSALFFLNIEFLGKSK